LHETWGCCHTAGGDASPTAGWAVIHIKPMSKIARGAYVKPDVAVTLQVEMQLPAAGWGVMNITSAGLKAWSFTDTVTFAAQPVYPKVRAVTVRYPIR